MSMKIGVSIILGFGQRAARCYGVIFFATHSTVLVGGCSQTVSLSYQCQKANDSLFHLFK